MLQSLRLGAIGSLAALSLGLTACGGGGSSSAPTPAIYTVGGNVTGLAVGQSVRLLDNSGDDYIATASGAFTLATGLAAGANYSVTIGTQPTGQTCEVTNGSGTIDSSNVTNVAVKCL